MYPPAGGMEPEVDPGFGQGVALGISGLVLGGAAVGGAVYPPAGGMEPEVDPGFGQGVAFGMPEPVMGGAAP